MNADKATNARQKSSAYVGRREPKTKLTAKRDFEEDLRCVKATLAIEGLAVSKEGLGNLKRIREKSKQQTGYRRIKTKIQRGIVCFPVMKSILLYSRYKLRHIFQFFPVIGVCGFAT